MNEETPLDIEIIVSEEDTSVYVKLTGFISIEDATTYAEHLVDYMPMMLFETTVMH